MLKLKKNFKISNLTSLKKCNSILILLISIVLVLLKSSDSLNIMAEENNLEITKSYSEARLFIALYIGEIRIIDNFKLY